MTLSEKRKELFDIILNQKPTAGSIYRIILKQDKEFIKELKEDDMFKLSGGELAKWLHDTYEKIAEKKGWDTQKKCKVEFEDLPKENKSVMLNLAQYIQIKFFTNYLLKMDKLAGKELVE